MTNEIEVAKKSSGKTTARNLKFTALGLGLLVVALIIALLWQSYWGPQRAAVSGLEEAAAGLGTIEAVNTDLVAFQGQKISTANTDQKGLAEGKELTSPPAFIFSNGKESSNRKKMDYYLDFSDQRSRDALIANSAQIKGLVESGSVELHIHPLLGGRAYSMYAAEALSEVFAADSRYAWEALNTLLRQAPALTELDSAEEVAKGIVSSLEKIGVTAVDEESLKNGTFASWLISIGDDPELNGSNQVRLPHILVNGKVLNLSVDELNNPEAFKKAVVRSLK